jgi:hypothetical protein
MTGHRGPSIVEVTLTQKIGEAATIVLLLAEAVEKE